MLVDFGQFGEETQHRLPRGAYLPPDAGVFEIHATQALPAPPPQRADSRTLPVDLWENLCGLGQRDELLVGTDPRFV